MRNIGIDFGTCNIKGAEKKKNGDVKPIKLGKDINKPMILNAIAYEEKEEKIIKHFGKLAITKSLSEQDRVRNIKSHLQDANWSKELSFGKKISAFEVTKDIMTNLHDEIYKSNKQEDVLATITVPVNFSVKQQKIVEKAATDAGFSVNAVITEPFAALFYLMEDNMDENHNVLIFDFGGGTLDLCIVEIKQKKGQTIVSTQATVGISYGGNNISDDILNEIIYKLSPDIIKENIQDEPNIFKKSYNKYSIIQAIDEMKEEFFIGDDIDEDLSKEIIAETYNKIPESLGEVSITDIYQMFDKQNWEKRINRLLNSLFADSDYTADEITDVFMVGGSSSIPYFKKIVFNYFENNGHEDVDSVFELNDDMDVEDRVYTSVSAGAAIYNQILADDEDIIIKDKIPFMIYAKDDNGKKIAILKKDGTYKDYYSPYGFISEKMKNENKISLYQTIFGEEDKEVYLGDFIFNDELLEIDNLFRIFIDSDRNIMVEIGYNDLEFATQDTDDCFCVDLRYDLKIDI